MSKFKVGDKVRIVGDGMIYRDRQLDEIGRVERIINIKENGLIDLTNTSFYYDENELELIESVDVKEMVNHPQHYNRGKYEAIDVIEDWKLNFNLGSAVKYIARCNHKNNKREDLEKAKWYIDREIGKLD